MSSNSWGVPGGLAKKKEKVEDPIVESETSASRRKRIQDGGFGINHKNGSTTMVIEHSFQSNGSTQQKKSEKPISSTLNNNSEDDIIGSTENDFLIHKVQGKETLQGLAIKYHVSAVDIMKVNKLFNPNDIFARKTLIIPTTMQQYLQNKQSSSSSNAAELDDNRKKELVAKFIGMTKCSEDNAYTYLSEKDWNFTKALGYYHQQQQPQAKTPDLVDFGDWTSSTSASVSQSSSPLKGTSSPQPQRNNGHSNNNANSNKGAIDFDPNRWKVDYSWEQQAESYRRAREEYEHEKSQPSAIFFESPSELIHTPGTPTMQRLRKDADEFFDL